MSRLGQRLEQQRARRLYRGRQVLEGPQGTEIAVDGRQCLAFCSNDYLGLANHPALIHALKQGAERYGVGSGASHLVSGHMRSHEELEEALAAYTGRPRALLFSTGYMANLGALGTLAGRADRVYADRLDHASLIDAARLSGARLRRYPHAETRQLARWLDRDAGAGQTSIVTDGVFSMDGDAAPLPALATLAARHDAWLIVDDAHGLGVTGPDGRGTVAHFGLGVDAVPVLVGTLGKAFGTFGAFVAGSEELIEALIQYARTYIYTTALPPAVACATLAALTLAEQETWRRERLLALVERFYSGAAQLDLPVSMRVAGAPATPIVPLMVGDPGRAADLSRRLLEQGIMITAIRPPTVPHGTARLRMTFSAAHTEAQVDRLLETLAACIVEEDRRRADPPGDTDPGDTDPGDIGPGVTGRAAQPR